MGPGAVGRERRDAVVPQRPDARPHLERGRLPGDRQHALCHLLRHQPHRHVRRLRSEAAGAALRAPTPLPFPSNTRSHVHTRSWSWSRLQSQKHTHTRSHTHTHGHTQSKCLPEGHSACPVPTKQPKHRIMHCGAALLPARELLSAVHH